jgi:TolB-like protein/Tfp pilus assembly protein PilF
MPSIIEGYNYDIFISYRQKDNKHDGWVTEFVDNLKGELEATFKEDISIYFDENPHDGLLETHNVDKSLEDKLKCLIFIPIVSQTYCDPKSYAWQYEFCAFNKLAKEDRFGRDIKLTSGNVASRILPVKIHDLDPEDKELLENELGELLRGIEFIYKEAGVNRPLQANEDHPHDNLNKTYYRDQINKVANAGKEIISAIKHYRAQTVDIQKSVTKPVSVPPKREKTTLVAGSVIIIAIIILGILFIPKLFKPSEELEKSIAVLPFINDSPDQENAYFINGIMDEILNNLQRIKDFRVPSRTSTEQYRGESKPSTPEIAKQLGVHYIVEGSGQKYGNTIRLRVQLIVVTGGKESHLWGESYEQNISEVKDYFLIQSRIAESIAGELKTIITPEEKELIEKTPTTNLTAYDFYLRGKDYYNRSFSEEDQRYAIQMYEKAVAIDPNLSLAWVGLAASSRNLFSFSFDRSEKNLSMTKKYLDKALSLSPELKEVKLEEAGYYDQCKRDYLKSLQILETLKTEYPNDDEIYFWIGLVCRRIGEFRKSFDNLNHAISLNPAPWKYWWNAAISLAVLRNYTNSEKYCLQAINLNPSNLILYGQLFNVYVLHGQIQKAREFLKNNEKSFDSKSIKVSQAELELISRNYKEAIEITQSITEDLIYADSPFLPLNVGIIYREMKNNTMAVKHFETERNFLLEKISESGDDSRLYGSLGIAYAGLGMKEQALKAGKKALDILNLDIDRLNGFQPEMNMVMILVMVEEYDEAMIRLDKIIKYHGFISVEILKIDPFWDPVRNNEKFQEIINNPAYQVTL